MIGHYLRSALKNFWRRPVNTVIKLLALSLGLACLLTAHTIGDYFAQADRHWAKSDRTYLVVQETARPGGWMSAFLTAAPVLTHHLRADFPELETVARMSLFGSPAGVEGQERTWQAFGADPEILDVFNLEMVNGEASLVRPRTILIDDQVAQEAFGGVDAAVGRTMTLPGNVDVVVSGVFRRIQPPSHLSASGGIQATAFIDMGTADLISAGNLRGADRPVSELEGYDTSLFMTYAVLPADGVLTADAFARGLTNFAERRVPQGSEAVRFRLVPLMDISQRRFDQRIGEVAGTSVITALYLLGALTLVIGCINFANLAAAEASVRAREIGLRKTLGAKRQQVAAQMLAETGLLAAGALVLVLPFSALLATTLANQFALELTPPGFGRPDYWAGVAAIGVGAALAAGVYPALVLAGLRPAFAIRVGALRGGAPTVRALLTIAQFAAAGFLLVMVLVMLAQKSELRRAALRPGEDPIVSVNLPLTAGLAGADRAEDILRRLRASPAVTGATLSIAPFMRVTAPMELAQSRAPDAPRIPAQLRSVYFDYFTTMDVALVAGRPFSRDRDDSRSVIIDAVTAALMGLSPEDAVGKPVYPIPAGPPAPGQSAEPPELTIVGVIERAPLELQASGPTNLVFRMEAPALGGSALVRLAKDDVDRGVAHVRAVWAEAFPGAQVNPVFLDDAFDAAYRDFNMINVVFAALSGIAVAIAATGLFGMGSFIVQRRLHEVGVRKTLGASSGRVLRQLLWDFSKPVLVANLIAWPLAWFAAQAYLAMFVNRIPLTAEPFLIALAATLAVAWLSVGGQAWRAASVKPALVLRAE